LLRKPYRAEELLHSVRQVLRDGPPGPSTRGGLRVIVVEDDPLVRMATVDMLQEAGLDVVAEAATARDALEELARLGGSIDVLFTDIGLPGGMLGDALALEARRRFPELSIVVASGHEHASMSLGGTERVQTLLKPFGPADVARIAQVLTRNKRSALA
jgi:DNA-binding response OmpR family regulator